MRRFEERPALTRIELAIVILIIIVLVGIFLPGVQRHHEANHRITCTFNLKQLGLALHAYHDLHGKFPVEDYDPKLERVQVNPRWHEFSLYIGLLPFIEEGHQLAAKEGEWMLASTEATTPPRTGSAATPVKSLLCPSRRTVAVGPRTDYAAATQWSMYFTHPITRKQFYANSILGAASMCATDAGQRLFTGTTMGEVNKADGTAATIFLSHKEMEPATYTHASVTPYDAYFGDLSQQYPYDHNRDLWDWSHGPAPAPELLRAPGQDAPIETGGTLSFGSPHPGAMPTLYADGSVRNFAYTEAAKVQGLPVTTAQVWQALWGYNDGVELKSY